MFTTPFPKQPYLMTWVLRLNFNRLPTGLLRLAFISTMGLYHWPALAWNATGHRDVVAVAWHYAEPQTQFAIQRLLQNQVVIPNLTHRSLEEDWMVASLWPDELRDPTDRNLVPALPHTPQQWLQRARTGEATRRWHFADRDVAKAFDQQIAQGLLEEALNAQIQILGDPTQSPQNRAVALAWVSHLVADAHQPLHTASRADPARPGQLDAGGNTVTVIDAGRRPPDPLSLHRWWDDLPGHAKPGTPRFEQETTRLIQQAHGIPETEIDQPPHQWIAESFGYAQTRVYPGLMPDPDLPYTYLIRQDYWQQGRDLSRTRLALAGRRLAFILNTALKDLH